MKNMDFTLTSHQDFKYNQWLKQETVVYNVSKETAVDFCVQNIKSYSHSFTLACKMHSAIRFFKNRLAL